MFKRFFCLKIFPWLFNVFQRWCAWIFFFGMPEDFLGAVVPEYYIRALYIIIDYDVIVIIIIILRYGWRKLSFWKTKKTRKSYFHNSFFKSVIWILYFLIERWSNKHVFGASWIQKPENKIWKQYRMHP